jgi:hypothetical protein
MNNKRYNLQTQKLETLISKFDTWINTTHLKIGFVKV